MNKIFQACAAKYLDAAPIMMILVAAEAKVKFINRAGCDALGCEASDVTGRDWFAGFMPETDNANMRKHFEQIFAGKEKSPRRLEGVIRTKNGEEKIVSWRTAAVLDEDGNVESVLYAGEDITARKRTEEELERLASFPELNPNPVIETDYYGRVCYINPVAKNLFPALEADGPGHDYLSRWDTVIGYLNSGERSTMSREVKVGGSWFLQTCEALRAIGRIRIYGVDITERRKAEQQLLVAHSQLEIKVKERTAELQSANERLRQHMLKLRAAEKELQKSGELLERIFSHTEFMIAYLDVCFNFIRLNQAYAGMDGRSVDFFKGKNFFDLYPDAKNKAIFQSVVDTGEGYKIYAKPFVYAFNPEQGTIYCDMSLQPVKNQSGAVDGLMLFLVNVTDRKKAEDELLKAREELAAAKRLSDVGTLSATVAHELRNPLAAIQMAAHNIRWKADNPLIEKHLLNIEKKVAESDQIIGNLLFYSRIKPLRFEKINVAEILQESVASARERFPKHEVSVEAETGYSKNIAIDADPLQIREVLGNLLNNSYDAFENRKGRIKVNTSLEGDNFIKIQIKDDGPGISPENLQHLFEPFFTTKAKGTGLGVTVCQQIIQLHGGKLDIASEPNRGTTVTIALPLKRT